MSGNSYGIPDTMLAAALQPAASRCVTNYLQFAYFVNAKVPHTVSRTENVVHKYNI